jgi:hypothetical protein
MILVAVETVVVAVSLGIICMLSLASGGEA